MVRAALNGQLDDVPTHPDPIFGLHVPEHVPDVPTEVLNPREMWADRDAYDAQATKVARLFHENFAKFADGASEAVKTAGPLVS
jgi:phosphoenolpyruvate carboxykinase (ATP)